MALTRRGQASAAGAGGPKAAGVRKPGAKVKAKPGAVVTKRLVVRRSGSRKGPGSQAAPSSQEQRAAAEQRGPPDQEEDEDQDPQEQQQPAPGAKRRRSTAAAAAGGGSDAEATIDALSAEALQEVFLNIGQEQQSYCRCGAGSGTAVARRVQLRSPIRRGCSRAAPERPSLPSRREILPLVCKRFRDVLLEPSCVWEVSTQLPSRTHRTRPAPSSSCHVAPAGDRRLASAAATPLQPCFLSIHPPTPQSLHIDFIQKGLDLAFPQLQQPGDGDGVLPPEGGNRRLLHSAVERWLKPRAAAVKRLVLS